MGSMDVVCISRPGHQHHRATMKDFGTVCGTPSISLRSSLPFPSKNPRSASRRRAWQRRQTQCPIPPRQKHEPFGTAAGIGFGLKPLRLSDLRFGVFLRICVYSIHIIFMYVYICIYIDIYIYTYISTYRHIRICTPYIRIWLTTTLHTWNVLPWKRSQPSTRLAKTCCSHPSALQFAPERKGQGWASCARVSEMVRTHVHVYVYICANTI